MLMTSPKIIPHLPFRFPYRLSLHRSVRSKTKQSQTRLVPVDGANKEEGANMSWLYVLGLCLLFSSAFGQDVRLEPSGIILLELEESVKLTCVASSPAYVVFLQDGMVVENSTSDTLNITYEDDGSVKQGGTYLCMANNIYSSSTATVWFAPLITEEPADVFTTVNGNVQLNCSAVGFPAPQLQWIRLMPGEDLTDLSTFDEIDIRDSNLPEGAMVLFSTDVDNNSSFDNNSIFLIFDGIEPTDFGSYVCVATLNNESFINSTSNLTDVPFAISDISVLTVSPRSLVTIDPSPSVTVNNGGSITFNCSAGGGPNNMFTWVRTEDLISVDTDLQSNDSIMPIDIKGYFTDLSESIIVNGSFLNLTSVNGTNDGGSYTCLVINEAGVGREDTILYVRPVITVQPRDELTEAGQQVNLTCLADSFPAPTYQWEMMNRTTEEFEPIDDQTDTTLTLTDIDHEQYGRYRCRVTTPIINENITSNVALITVSPKDSVSATPINQIVSYNGTAVFSCTAEGGPNNTFRWVRGTPFFLSDTITLSDFDSLEVVGTDTQLTLTMVNGSTGGQYTCVVFNDAGYGNDTVTLYVSPRILTQPEDQFVQNGDNVTFTCIADSFPAPTYQWERLNTSDSIFESLPGETNTTLVFEPIEHEDFGRYKCVVTTPITDEHVNSSGKTVRLYLFFIIIVSPKSSVIIIVIIYSKNSSDVITVSGNGSVPSVTVNDSESITFNCSADGGPNNMFAWVRTEDLMSVDTDVQPTDRTTPIDIEGLISQFSDSILINSSSLTIDSVNSTLHGGSYTCLVINEAGVGREDTILYVRPVITVQPMDVNAENGSRVVLTCIANSFPEPEYQWERLNSSGHFEPIYQETETTLVFDPVTFSDFGTYRCVVTTPIIDVTVISNQALLTISPNNSVSVVPSMITVDNGSSVTFTCSARGSEDNYFAWFITDELDLDSNQDLFFSVPLNISRVFNELNNITIVNGSNLTINSINATQDGGSYRCLVFNVAGSSVDDGELFVNPVITIPPSDVLANEGDRVSLTCFADSFEAPNYQWEFRNRTTRQFELLEGENRTELLLDPIEYEEYGMYRCNVTATVSDGNEATVSSEPALVTVSPRGSVSIDPQITNSFNGSSVSLTCSAEGGPGNTFQWTYSRTGEVVSTTTQYTLTSSITTGGEYQCTVTNGAGNDTDNATVNVGPIITQDPESINVTILTSDFTLTCEAIGIPVPFITWSHNDSVVNEGGVDGEFENGLFISTTEELGTIRSVLTIDSALANHTGEYFCNATSTVSFYESVMSQVALVLVQDVPERPVNLTAVEVNSRNVTLEWVEPHPNNAPILNYTVFYDLPDFLGSSEVAVSTQGDEEMLLILELHPGETYSFTVIATNEEGDSEESEPLVVRTLEEAPSDFPQNLTALTLNSTAITVSWDEVLVNETNGIITQYNVTAVPDESFADVVEMLVNNSIFSVVFDGLEEFVVYRFTISARTEVGFGPTSPEVSARTDEAAPAGFPQNLDAFTLNSTAITVSWDEVLVDEANGIITQYNVTAVPDESFADAVKMLVNSSTFSVVFDGLEEFVVYRFTISARTEVGFGPTSPEVSNRTDEAAPAGFPQNLTALTLNSTAITLSWDEVLVDEANGIITQYNVTAVPDEPFADIVEMLVNNSTFSVVFNGLEEFVVYQFTISARTEVGFGPTSPEVLARTDEAAPAGFPQNLTVETLNSTAITVSWDDVLVDEANGIITQYNVTAVPDESFADVVEMLVNNSTFSVVFNGLEEFVVYQFTISARTVVGFGPTSPEVSARTSEAAPAGFPQNLTALTLNSTAITVSWDEVLVDETNGIITQYNVTAVPDESFANVVEMLVNNSTFTVVFDGLEEFVVYRFTISARTEVGFGPTSPEVSARTSEAAPESPPVNFTVTNITANSITLEWNPPPEIDINGIIDRYVIRYRITEQLGVESSMLPTEINETNIIGNTTLNTVLTDLDNYTVYNISIAAVTVGEGPEATLSQRTDENAPEAAPVFISATTNSTTAITVTWEPPPLNMTNGIIDSYQIRYGRFNRTTMDIFRDINITTIEGNTTLEFNIGGLQEFIEYGFQVRAVTVAPGPYTGFANNTTFQAAPAVAPGRADDPVPEGDLTPTSVRLVWDPLDPDDANGELTYNVSISVRGQSVESRRKRRETDTNTLNQCLAEAGIMPPLIFNVSGDQTSLTVDNIAPNTNYSFIVAGVTDAGIGPFSDPVDFSTPEGVPTVPREVTLTSTSSSSFSLVWQPPICDNGVRRGYRITYNPLMGPDPQGELGDLAMETTANADANSQIFTGLTPNSPYEVVICALTGTGCGINFTVNQTTDEDAPLSVTNAALSNQSVAEIVASWLPPSDRNGSFNITINYTAAQVFRYENRIQTDSREMELFGSSTQTTRNETISEVLPYALYTVTITAFNRLFGRSLSSSPVTVTTISQPTGSSTVTNMSTVAITSSKILVQWDIPLSPNGPISYFRVCINDSVCYEDTDPTATNYTLANLTSLGTYYITVQPITVFMGSPLNGAVSESQRVVTNITAVDVLGTLTYITRGIQNIRVALPNYQLFNGTVIFYGVVVVEGGTCNRVTDYGGEYPNPQPRSSSRRTRSTVERLSYYIAGGWDDTSEIPDNFNVGGGGSTTATRLGREETYSNPSLSRESKYCILALVYLDSGVPGQPIIRYVSLANASTRLGYNEAALGFFMALIILLIIAAIVVVVVFILYKRYKTQFYSLVHKERGEYSRGKESINGTSGMDLVIVNPPVGNTIEKDPAGTQWHDPSTSRVPIHIKEFPGHVASMHSNDDYLFSVEYPSVEPRHNPTTEATHHPDNAVKNRYANITAYDHSRVRLREIPNVPGSDYVNANFIDGYKSPNAYIASQGPVPHSIPDFWRMIWEQESATIVMLTNLEEKGRVKCHLYWPPANKRVQVHGLIRVQLQEELQLSDHTIRTFSLQKDKGDERIVKQFHFTAWPDFGVPEHPTPLLRFIRKVEASNPVNAGPMIVHCSAGVGRTGTFITIKNQIRRIKDVQTIDIFNFVQAMRHRRCFMVQTEAQYIFIHDAILEVIECGETEVSARELKEQYRKLSTFNETEGLMNIEIEYERIQETIHTEPVRYAGTLQFNRQKNRFHNVIPFDKTRCRLSAIPGIDGSDYVNANFIEGYLKGKAFVATQGPLPDTAEDFWRMVLEYKSSTIVMLAKEKEGSKVMCHRYWPDETTGSEMHGPFEISLHSIREYPDYVLREIQIVDTRDAEGSSHQIKQFHYTGWPMEGVPNSAIGLLDIREQVEKWQRNSGDKPIVVHCSGGCGRTGTYIAICLLIDRLKTEGVVDVFQTVRGLRLQRPGMIRSVEQYDFTYKALLEYLGSFDNYANFSL